jgi:hypothetical protein
MNGAAPQGSMVGYFFTNLFGTDECIFEKRYVQPPCEWKTLVFLFRLFYHSGTRAAMVGEMVFSPHRAAARGAAERNPPLPSGTLVSRFYFLM